MIATLARPDVVAIAIAIVATAGWLAAHRRLSQLRRQEAAMLHWLRRAGAGVTLALGLDDRDVAAALASGTPVGPETIDALIEKRGERESQPAVAA